MAERGEQNKMSFKNPDKLKKDKNKVKKVKYAPKINSKKNKGAKQDEK